MQQSMFQFDDPVLLKMEFAVNDNFDKDKFEAIALGYNTSINREDEENRAIVNLNLTIGKGPDEENSPFYVDAIIAAVFKWESVPTSSFNEKLLTVNAAALLLSYLRPIIFSITGSSPFPGYNIPFLDFTEEEAAAHKECDE